MDNVMQLCRFFRQGCMTLSGEDCGSVKQRYRTVPAWFGGKSEAFRYGIGETASGNGRGYTDLKGAEIRFYSFSQNKTMRTKRFSENITIAFSKNSVIIREILYHSRYAFCLILRRQIAQAFSAIHRFSNSLTKLPAAQSAHRNDVVLP